MSSDLRSHMRFCIRGLVVEHLRFIFGVPITIMLKIWNSCGCKWVYGLVVFDLLLIQRWPSNRDGPLVITQIPLYSQHASLP